MERIKVLHMIPTLGVGGAERQLITLLRSMDRQRFDHKVAVLTREGTLAGELKRANFPLHHFHFRYRYLPAKILEIRRYLLEQNIDVLHAHLHMAGVWGRVAAGLAHTPVAVYTEHAHVRGRNLGWRLFERLLAPRTSLKVSVSEARRLESIRYEWFPANKVVTLRNSVQLADYDTDPELRRQTRLELGIPEDKILIGNVSVLRPKKRLGELLRTVSKLYQENPDVSLIIVGDGPDATRLRDLARKLHLDPMIQFLGTRTDVPALMQAMDIYAISSEIEGIPINLLEAMASSLPVVSSAVGGIPEVISHGSTGLLFDFGDREACLGHLLDLCASPELRARLGASARSHVAREHSSQVNAKRLEDYYLKLLSDTRRLHISTQ